MQVLAGGPYGPLGCVALLSLWYYVYENRAYSGQIAESGVSPFTSRICLGGAESLATALGHPIREDPAGLLPGSPSRSPGHEARLGMRRGRLFPPGADGVPRLPPPFSPPPPPAPPPPP